MAQRVAVLMNEIPTYRLPLLQALQDRVDELRVFLSTAREPDRNWAIDWGTLDVVVQKTITITRKRRHPQGYRQTMFVHVPYDTLAQLFRFRPDVIISGEMGARSLQAALYRKLVPSTRLLIWCTLSEVSEAGWSKMRTRMRRLLISGADGFLVNGESGRRYLQRMGAPDDRIFIANQPVDIDLFTTCSSERCDTARRRMLYSGRLIPKKGLQTFQAEAADWARSHPEQTVTIRWLGDAYNGDALKSFTAPPNMVQEFAGAVTYEVLPRHYAESGVLVLPTLDDEWGLVVNEAFASGIPVIGSIYSQAVEELVKEGETGWLFDPHKPSAATHAIDRFFATPPSALGEMGERARQQIRRLTPAATAAVFTDAIDKIRESRASAM